MKIIMEKRKPGIYAQWYEVFAEPKEGDRHVFLIFADQAKNYAQAVRFWNKTWGKKYKALYLINAEPFNLNMAC
jgi:hypothetical protein